MSRFAEGDASISTMVESAASRSRHTRLWVEIWHKGLAALRAQWYLRNAHVHGAKSRVWGRPFLDVQGKLIVGERVQFISTRAQLEILVEAQGTLEIGDDTIINYGTSICATRHVRIGRGALVGMHAIIMDTDYHRLDPLHRQERPESLPIVLEENVWLAARVVVLRGVTIGANSVIGAGSVVTKDIPPNVFAAGLPARVIKHL